MEVESPATVIRTRPDANPWKTPQDICVSASERRGQGASESYIKRAVFAETTPRWCEALSRRSSSHVPPSFQTRIRHRAAAAGALPFLWRRPPRRAGSTVVSKSVSVNACPVVGKLTSIIVTQPVGCGLHAGGPLLVNVPRGSPAEEEHGEGLAHSEAKESQNPMVSRFG